MPQLSLHSPVGALTLSEEGGAIVALDFGWGRDQDETALLRRARDQVHEYLDCALHEFDLPLHPVGTAYQRKVWGVLAAVPYGRTITYAAAAERAGGSARSVGQANRCNPIPILIPCHRVVARHGLGGYCGAEGLETKRFLLQLEAGSVPQAAGPG